MCLTLHDPMDCSTPGLLVPHCLLEFAQVHVHCIGDALQPCHPVTPFFWLQSFPTSGSFPMSPLFTSFDQISTSPSKENSGLTSFKTDLFCLLAVQGTLKSLLHHQSLKASILQCSAFFMVQLSHPYMTPEKTIALTRWTFVSNVSAF